MCGRYSLLCIDDLGNRFRVYNPMIGAPSRFNIAPGSGMPVIRCGKHHELSLMRWGGGFSGGQRPASVPLPINARSETLTTSPLFRPLLENGRCLVPASGFYEWKEEGRRTVPFYFRLPEHPLFAFAGLYDTRQSPDGTPSAVYTILTCAPNTLVAEVHSRMPVILSRENEDWWLSPDPPAAQDLSGILVPYPAAAMARVPVAGLVNDPALDDERVIRPLRGLSG
jgi:putative SOS response-associated peptidase YedK